MLCVKSDYLFILINAMDLEDLTKLLKLTCVKCNVYDSDTFQGIAIFFYALCFTMKSCFLLLLVIILVRMDVS